MLAYCTAELGDLLICAFEVAGDECLHCEQLLLQLHRTNLEILEMCEN